MRRLALACLLAVVVAGPAAAAPFQVRFDVQYLGSFTVELHDDTPLHRDNFLQYVNDGAFTDSFIHRSDSSVDIIQGGGSYFVGTTITDIPTPYAPVPLEADLGWSNVLGTLGAARTADPDSATSGWFLNMADNSDIFDPVTEPPGQERDGYTVFGHVVDGWDVAEAIYALNVWNATALLGGAFGNLPLHDTFDNTGPVYVDDFVIITGAEVVPEPATLALLAAGALALLRRRRK